MAIRDQTGPVLVTVYCDRCGDEATHDYLVPAGSDSLDVARAHLAKNGWAVSPASDLCPACSARHAKAGSTELPANPRDGVPCTEIDVPSGKLIVADNLGRVEHFSIEPPMSINTAAGTDAWARLLAAQANTAYAYVGNSCPSVIRTADGALEVMCLGWDEGTDRPGQLSEGEEKVAAIRTDLWAAMATDYQNWLDHGGPDVTVANKPYAVEVFTVIDVEPGRYRWIAYSHVDSFDMDAEDRITYARLERIED